MWAYTEKLPPIMAFLSVCMAFTLIFSFGLHSVETQHTHLGHEHQHEPNTHGHDGTKLTLGEYAHMAEKKSLYALFILAFTVAVFSNSFWCSWTAFLRQIVVIQTTFARYRKRAEYSIIDYLTISFSRGILNPQLH
jgi:hypothetical protein